MFATLRGLLKKFTFKKRVFGSFDPPCSDDLPLDVFEGEEPVKQPKKKKGKRKQSAVADSLNREAIVSEAKRAKMLPVEEPDVPEPPAPPMKIAESITKSAINQEKATISSIDEHVKVTPKPKGATLPSVFFCCRSQSRKN